MPFHPGEIERLKKQGVREFHIANLEHTTRVLAEHLQRCDLRQSIAAYSYFSESTMAAAASVVQEGGPVDPLETLSELRREALDYTVKELEA